MLYVQLDTNWPDNHKIIEAGVDGAGAHAILLCLAKRLEDDGWVRVAVLKRHGIDEGLLERLADLRLIEYDRPDQARPWGWHDRNDSQAVIAAKRATKREAGARGNHNRWHPGVRYEDCEKCQVVAGSDRNGSQEMTTAIAPDPTPTSRATTEVTTAIAPANDLERRAREAAHRFSQEAIA